MTAAPGGRWLAVVLHGGRLLLLLLDTRDDSLRQPEFAGQGDIFAAASPTADRMLVADRGTRVIEYGLPACEPLRRLVPEMGLVERAHRYAILPVCTAFPKPGELDETVQHVLGGDEPDGAAGEADLNIWREPVHPWRPVVSSLVFAAAMLAFGCFVIQRREF